MSQRTVPVTLEFIRAIALPALQGEGLGVGSIFTFHRKWLLTSKFYGMVKNL